MGRYVINSSGKRQQISDGTGKAIVIEVGERVAESVVTYIDGEDNKKLYPGFTYEPAQGPAKKSMSKTPLPKEPKSYNFYKTKPGPGKKKVPFEKPKPAPVKKPPPPKSVAKPKPVLEPVLPKPSEFVPVPKKPAKKKKKVKKEKKVRKTKKGK